MTDKHSKQITAEHVDDDVERPAEQKMLGLNSHKQLRTNQVGKGDHKDQDVLGNPMSTERQRLPSARRHHSSAFKELISCDVNMGQLSTYMNHIIQVVNQHAKLLDTLTHELNCRPKKLELGEMFNVLSHSFPYDKVLHKYGMDPTQAQPRSIYITEQLIKN